MYNVQTHRLCGGVSSGLLLRGREHAGDQSRRMYRLWSLRTRMSRRCHQTDTDDEGKAWVDFNSKWSTSGWPVLTTKKDSLDPEGKHKDEPNKLEKYFKDK